MNIGNIGNIGILGVLLSLPSKSLLEKSNAGFMATPVACGWAGSAIPVALLNMIVTVSVRKQGSGPKGDEAL